MTTYSEAEAKVKRDAALYFLRIFRARFPDQAQKVAMAIAEDERWARALVDIRAANLDYFFPRLDYRL